MKKIFLLCVLLPQMLLAQKPERYCELVAVDKSVFTYKDKVTIHAYFGNEERLLKDTRLSENKREVTKCTSVVDALNYMGAQNWKLVNVSSVKSERQNFIFKQEYDIPEPASGIKK